MKFSVSGSMKRKLLLINVISMGTGLLLVISVLFAHEFLSFRKDTISLIGTQAKILSHNTAAALLFNDRQRAAETLASLKNSLNITQAVIYDRDRKVFAEFLRKGEAAAQPPPYPDHTGYFFSTDSFYLFEPIVFDGETIGMLYINSDMSHFFSDILANILGVAIAFLAAFGLALLLILRLQDSITGPFLSLTGTIDRIFAEGDYSLRAEVAGSDELSRIAAGFNAMITQIQRRKEELKAYQQNLVTMVKERTLELNDANLRLTEELHIKAEKEIELQQARDAAIRATESKSKFLAGMSHEIRTPLNAVIGLNAFVLESDLSPQQRQCIETAKSSAEALLVLLNDLLDLSKIEAGRLELESLAFNPGDLLDEVIGSFYLQASKKGLYLRKQAAPGMPECLIGDKARLRQVLINLLGNALKFTHEGGVSLTAASRPDTGNEGQVRLVFSVADTGIGIPQDQLGIIFESFSQADGSITRNYGGTGLGLSIVKELVEKMGGEIRVESAVGKGSSFTVELPFDIAKQNSPEDSGLQTAAAPALSLRVLLVDDTEQNRMVEGFFCCVKPAGDMAKAEGPADVIKYEGIIDKEALRFCYGDNKDIIKEVFAAFPVNVPRQRIAQISEALGKGDMELLERLAHSLKGAAGTVGGQKLLSAAEALEAAARGKDKSLPGRLCGEVEEEYERLLHCISDPDYIIKICL